MLISFGTVGLLLIGFLAIVTFIAGLFHSRFTRWFMAVTLCIVTAALLTPSDPLSTVLVGTACFVCYLIGSKQELPQATKA